MAKKKNQKRQHSRTVELKRQAEQEKLAGEKDRAKNRWNPAGRALLYIDLVFLAVSALLDANNLVSEFVSGLFTLLGVILLLAALWLLFGNKKGGSSVKKSPRL